MSTLVILEACTAWDAERVNESARCTICHAVYPGRLMTQVVDGVCDECREAA